MIRAACLLVLCGTAGSAIAQDIALPALFDVTGVAADDSLNIRARGSVDAAILGTLPPDATGIEVIALVDGWALINAGEQSGYVRDSFLTAQPNPDWFALQSQMTCLGTEPFWALAIDPALQTVTFTSPDTGWNAAITTTWPGAVWQPRSALETTAGFITLGPALCVDGMSDRVFGIFADIYLSGQGAGRYSGCCSLAP